MTTVRTPRGYPRKARIDRETLALFERLERVPQQQRSDQAFQADERSLHRWLGMEIIWLCGCASVLDRSSAPCWPDGRLACEAWASARKMRGELLEATGIGRRGPIREEAAGVRRAQAVITFIERLIVPSGAGEGSPIRLMDWQKEADLPKSGPERREKTRQDSSNCDDRPRPSGRAGSNPQRGDLQRRQRSRAGEHHL